VGRAALEEVLIYACRLLSPLVHDILAAYRMHDCSAKRAVEYLNRAFPRRPTESAPRFADLSESTVRGWHDADGKLLPKFSAQVRGHGDTVPRGPGRTRVLAGHPEIEDEVKRLVSILRERGAVVNILVLRQIMRIVVEDRRPALLADIKFSNHFVSCWAREQMGWSWRVRTTAASKLPLDWREQGVQMAKRIAFAIQVHKVHPSLVVNMDQTGVHLAPVDSRTYEAKGSKEVKVIGAEDKRQITACVASSLDGDLLPLQLIFQGKTSACHPPATPESVEAKVLVTHSENHWSNQETMQQWVRELLIPYAERQMLAHTLPADSKICLVLDVWAVHKSEEFRKFLRMHFPQVHLVYVPANCTSELQVADVVLQRPFKHGLRQRFNTWAAELLREQVQSGDLIGLSPYLKMSVIKPLLLSWVVKSWKKMKEGRDYIKFGWHMCCITHFNMLDPVKRLQVVESVAKGEFEARGYIPPGDEKEEADSEPESDEDDEKDELDIMKQRQHGERKSTRKRSQAQTFGFQLNSQQIAMSEDSEH
jgi:hypothetical protein